MDVVIVGGGIFGCATAHFLAQAAPGARIVVLEPDPTYARSSSVRSAAAVRQQFADPLNVALSAFGWRFYAGLATHSAGVVAPAEPCPYVVLATEAGAPRLAAAHRAQVEAGAHVTLLDPDEAAARFPWLVPDGLGAVSVGEEGEGFVDAPGSLRYLRAWCLDAGVALRDDAAVGIALHADGAEVRLAGGETLRADRVINCAGAAGGRVGRLAGLEAPIESHARSAFVFAVDAPPTGFTNLIDPTFEGHGIYARPFGDAFMAITAPRPEDDPETDELAIDDDLFDDVLRPALERRVRGFAGMRRTDAWAGLYELSTFDTNGFVGPDPAAPAFVWATGFSGHGLMHAPAIGRGVAELVTTGRYATLDLAPLGIDRVAAGRPVADRHISEPRTSGAGI